jgi:hypothetical protein
MTLEDPTAVTLVRHNWAGDEAQQPGMWRELGRLMRRARRRWLRTLLYALGCTAVALVAVARTPPAYVSRVVLRATTGGPGRAAPASDGKALRPLVTRILATDARLAAHDGLEVEVWAPDRVALTLRGSDPQRVYDEVTALGRLLVDWRPDPRQKGAPRWELTDRGHVAAAALSGATLLVATGIFGFVLALLLCAVAVGAFDPRVYELDDVERLGLSTLGAVRSFDGDNAGALAARLARGRIDRP